MFNLSRSRAFPIGLHLTPRAVTLVQLAGSVDAPEVYALARGELKVNENSSTESQDREVAATIRKLLSDHRFSGRQVISCLGSQELFVQNVRLPKLPPEEVEKVVRWEAEERLPYPIDEAEIRYLLAGEVRQDANIKQEVILLACHQGVIRRHISQLELAGLAPLAIDVEPCALLRSLQRERKNEQPRRQAFVHLGDRATTVLFAEGDQILFLKYITHGGYHLDMAVARHLSLSLEEASAMRAMVTAEATLDRDDEVHRSIIEAIRLPLESLCSEVELCLRYHKVTFRGRPIERAIISGEEACPWLVEYLSDRLGTPCEIGNPFESLGHRARQADPGRWAPAVGLAMRPLEQGRPQPVAV